MQNNKINLMRIANLPTVWTSALAGSVLAGLYVFNGSIPFLLFALSLTYCSGLILNAAQSNPNASAIKTFAIYFFSYLTLGLSIWLVMVSAAVSLGIVQYAGLAALTLCTLMLIYNICNQQSIVGALFMGICRVFIYVTAGFTLIREPSTLLYAAAASTFCYVVGVSVITNKATINSSSFASLWPVALLGVPIGFGLMRSADSLPTLLFTAALAAWIVYALQFITNPEKRDTRKASAYLMASVALVDAIYISSVGFTNIALVAVGAFALTLLWQHLTRSNTVKA